MRSRRELLEQTIANRIRFQKALSAADLGPKTTDLEKLAALEAASKIAAATGTGMLRSSCLERSLERFANSLPTSKSTFRRGVLHVLSTPYASGGHTRVVERWVASDQVCTEHSVLVTEPAADEISTRLIQAVNRTGGRVLKMGVNLDVLERATFLRNAAKSYDFVVLHTHMHDIVPVIALGADRFDVPIIFYDHADHRFSVGMSVANLVAETRSWGAERSRLYRGINSPSILGIPSGQTISQENAASREVVRDNLGIPRDSRVLICSATPHKFMPYADWNLFSLLERLLRSSPDVWILIAGLDWKIFRSLRGRFLRTRELSRRLVLLPAMPEAKFRSYISCADLGIDTIPEGGCTTLMDYIGSGIPVVCHAPVTSQMDYLIGTEDYARSEQAFDDRCGVLLGSEAHRVAQLERQKNALMEETQAFAKRLARVYEQASSSPRIRVQQQDIVMHSDVDLLLTQQSIYF